MRADEISMDGAETGGVLRWLIAWAVYHLAWMWTCYWWVWRAHIAARHGFPRNTLEEPPLDWMRVLQGRGERDR